MTDDAIDNYGLIDEEDPSVSAEETIKEIRRHSLHLLRTGNAPDPSTIKLINSLNQSALSEMRIGVEDRTAINQTAILETVLPVLAEQRANMGKPSEVPEPIDADRKVSLSIDDFGDEFTIDEKETTAVNSEDLSYDQFVADD